MSRASVLARGRAAADEGFTDTCIITRVDPNAVQGPIDPDTLQYPPLARLTIYSGPCKLQIRSVVANASESEAGERQTTVQESELQLPVLTSGDVAVTDVAKMVTCPLDPSLVDREFTIKGRHGKSQSTSRRLRVQEAAG